MRLTFIIILCLGFLTAENGFAEIPRLSASTLSTQRHSNLLAEGDAVETDAPSEDEPDDEMEIDMGDEETDDEMEIEMGDEESDDEMEFDMGDEASSDGFSDPSTSPRNDQTGFWQSLIDPAKFTLEYERSYKTAAPEKTVNNRSSARIEYDKFFARYFFIRLDGKLTVYHGNDHIAKADDSKSKSKTSLREAYLQTSFSDTSIKIGKQIIVWGEADGTAVTDVVSPRDGSELFFISLDESRIGQNMILVEQFTGIGDFSLFYTPESETDKAPETGSEYDLALFNSAVYDVDERDSLHDSEYGFRWKKTFGKSDLAFMAANLIDNQARYKLTGVTADGRLGIEKSGQCYTMTGFAFNYASGNFIWKGEAAQKDKKAFNTAQLGIVERKTVDSALGFEYMLAGGYTIGVTYINTYISQWDDSIASAKQNDGTLTLTWSDSYLNEDLDISVTLTRTTHYKDQLGSITVDYTFDDLTSMKIEAFGVDISDKESPYYAYRDQNRLSASIMLRF